MPSYLLHEGEVQPAALSIFLTSLANAEEEVVRVRAARQQAEWEVRRKGGAPRRGGERATESSGDRGGGSSEGGEEGERCEDASPQLPPVDEPDAISDGPSAQIASSADAPPAPPSFDALWREREYRLKLGRSFGEDERRLLCCAYLQGVAWCAAYYFQKCPDWRWALPYHYAPFAADLAEISRGWRPEPW
ncbi:MAG: hypothetical protein SGPRY_004961, partial [Prymnesium sp.]